jgi:hypothetical protein
MHCDQGGFPCLSGIKEKTICPPAASEFYRSLCKSVMQNYNYVNRIKDVTYQTGRTDLLGLKDMGLLEMRKEGKKFLFTPIVGIAE